MGSKIFVFLLFVAGVALLLWLVYKVLCWSGFLNAKPKPVECEMTSQIEKLANKYHKQLRINRISADKLRSDADLLIAEAERLRLAADKLDEAHAEA